MMNGKSVLCNETFETQINVGVARHSIVGTTVYGATLRNHVKKVKHRGGNKAKAGMAKHCQEETRENDNNTTVTETTAEIVCIVCKDGASTRPNEIVLCDKCGVGYHQKCHNPVIEDKALEPEEPWMCIFCTNGSECPYLLNPFETKLRKDLNSMSVRKNREDSKDNHYMSNHAAGFIPNNPSRVGNLMANYYHDTYQRRSSMDTSHVRHVPREAHHVMNRRVMMERPKNKYYKYPDEDQRAERENLDARKGRLGSQEKQKTSRDVWDNGGHTPTSRDVSANDAIADDVSKSKGKEGPREKQRLTQDLERQRKKLKEDVKRGQELQREHTQLLTRDQMHDQSRDTTNSSRDHTSKDVPIDDRSDDDRKYDRRQYAHNSTAEYSENIRNSSEKRTHGDCKSGDVRVNGAGSGDETLKRKLDPCDCDDSSQGSGVNKHIHKMSDIQCEHSSSRENYHEVNGHADDANHEHARNTRGVHEHAREIHEHVNSEGTTMELYSSEKIEVIGESSDLSGYNEAGNEKSKVKTCQKSGHKRRKSSEGKIAYDEYLSVRKERRAKEGTKERSGSVKTDKGSVKDGSSGLKRSSCSDESIDNDHGGSKRNKAMNQDGGKRQHDVDYESDATQNRVRSDLPRHNWLVERWLNQKNIPGNEKATRASDEETRRASTESFKDTVKDSKESTSINNTLDQNLAMQTSASPVFEQTYKDEVLDEGYTKRISDDEITQDNEIIISQHENEILKVPSPVKYENDPLVQNNHSPEIKYSPTKQEQLSPRSLDNCSPEIKQYLPTVAASLDLVQSSPNLVESSPNFVQTSPKRVQISPNRLQTSLNSVPVSPSILQATSCGTTLSYQVQTSQNQVGASPNRVQASPNRLPSTSCIPQSPNRLPSTSNCITSSPNQISPNRIPESQRVPASPHRVSSNTSIPPPSPNQVPHSPNGRVSSSLPDGVAPSPNRIPASPHRVPSNIPAHSPNKVPQSPNRIPDRVAPSPNRIPVSPNEKTTKRPSPIGSGHSIETRQISPRFTPRTEQDLGGNQGELRTSQDRTGSREDRNGHNEHIHSGRLSLRRESLSGGEEGKIIEVTSDGEECKRGSTEEHKEVSRIQTGKSVNPVSPIIRSEKHAMEEMHPGIHEPRTQDLKPLRVPAELPPGLPFMGSAYVAGYPPKTFTPHLITHNAAGMHHPGHPALQGGLPGRLELCQHAKPDMNCPFHGKKVEKMHQHVPGYPVLSADAHIYPQHTLHDKLRDKRSEHLDLHSDPLAMQRRLSAVYDRHLVMPHGIPIHHPRYLAPGLIDEHGFPIDNERYKHRLEAAHPYAGIHKPQSHTPGGVSADTSKYVGSPSEEKRYALKYMEDKRHTSKDIGMQSENYLHHHREQSLMTSRLDRNDVKRFNISPQDMRPSRAEHLPRTRPESPGKYSPSVRHVKEAHPGYIQLGEEKKEKTGPESRPSPSPGTLDRESINRDFNERFNMLDKTFKEKLEGTDRSKEEVIAAYSSTQRRHGLEVGAPPRAWSENQARGVDPQKYRNPEKLSPNTKHSPSNSDEQRKLQDRASPRGLVTSVHTSTQKPTVHMPSYFHGNLLPGATHGFGRGMVGVPVMANHGDFGVWQSMRGPTRIPGYPPSSIQTQGISAEKNERLKPEYATAKREHQETERSLAIEKHRMNLAQLENERRKAMMAGKTERMDERRAESGEHERPSPRTREEELRRNWELENRKRKLEQPEVQLSPHARVQVDMNKRITDKSHHMPDELALRKEQYLAMYARQHEGYGMSGVPYPDRARSSGNPAFYMARMGSQAEASVTEALRKQREYNERQESIRKMVIQERGIVDSGEPAKKKIKNHRCMCGVCGKEASFLCSGCQKAWYCSAKCQHTAWAEHCKECTESKRR